MVRVLDLLQELLQLSHYSYERLDGTTSASARNAAVDRFKRESLKRFVMLLSTRAGGLGLNLTSADTVIIFDSDFNPQNDLQAMARAHRIGQTRSVRVYRLLTAKTYEMHMFHSASLKLGLDRAVLAHQRQNTNPDESSSKRKSKAEREEEAKEIDQLLKKGAYDVFNDDDDNEAQRFMDTDIDQLLEQSSRTVTYGETATSSLSSGLGSFSKASFVASTGDGEGKDVDLDDVSQLSLRYCRDQHLAPNNSPFYLVLSPISGPRPLDCKHLRKRLTRAWPSSLTTEVNETENRSRRLTLYGMRLKQSRGGWS